MRPTSHRSQDGFTLLEVLVTLVLTSLVLAGMPSALHLANAGFRRASAALATDESDRAMDLIEQKLSGAIPVFQHSSDGLLNIVFHGNAHAISFVAPLVHASYSGLFRFTLSEVAAGQGTDVVLTLQPYWLDSADLPIVEQRILKRNAGLAVQYFGQSPDANGVKWTNEWTARDNLPKLVTLSISQPKAPPRDRTVELRLRNRNDLN